MNDSFDVNYFSFLIQVDALMALSTEREKAEQLESRVIVLEEEVTPRLSISRWSTPHEIARGLCRRFPANLSCFPRTM